MNEGRSAPDLGAAIDVGSSSVHLLVATVGGDGLHLVEEASAFLGLGSAVRDRRRLGSEKAGELVAALTGFADRARELEAGSPTVVATEPLRRALDAARVVRLVERDAGLALHVLSHEEEGLLTLIGVTGGRPPTDGLVVVDVGGGSTEVVAADERRAVAVGLPLGTAQLTDRYVRHDPPTATEMEGMLAEARSMVGDAIDGTAVELVAVGGTADKVARIVPDPSLGSTLTASRLAAALEVLGRERADDLAVRHDLRPVRARLLPAGVAILMALIERYRAERIRVSASGIREGSIIAVRQAGVGWRDALPRLAAGSR
ncbi:MAG TPA: hypothetical protein VM344_03615 [Vitreimonas sp.]|nr:hypothetical protein [Vitreimonas sp.]